MLHDRIEYSFGNEHSPVDPFGRVELGIGPEGVARLEHISRAGTQAWTAMVRPAALAELRAALAGSPFPEVPPTMPVPDMAFLKLSVGRVVALIDPPTAAAIPAYARVFALLDAMVAEMSDGSASPRGPDGPALVVGIARA